MTKLPCSSCAASASRPTPLLPVSGAFPSSSSSAMPAPTSRRVSSKMMWAQASCPDSFRSSSSSSAVPAPASRPVSSKMMRAQPSSPESSSCAASASRPPPLQRMQGARSSPSSSSAVPTQPSRNVLSKITRAQPSSPDSEGVAKSATNRRGVGVKDLERHCPRLERWARRAPALSGRCKAPKDDERNARTARTARRADMCGGCDAPRRRRA
mmetsp:Transcript_86639/g.249992  ORF Transcript_86639/g.249992 Transcript_86639/m.249992 type:complete len:212 (-) Transcript_86639:7-642(-)